MLAVVVGRVELQAQLLHQFQCPVLGRADPLAAHLDHLAAGVRDLPVQRAAADPVPGLQNRDVIAGGTAARWPPPDRRHLRHTTTTATDF